MKWLLLLLLFSTPAHADSWIPYVGGNPVSDTGSNGTGKAMFDTGPIITGQLSTGSIIVTGATPPSGDGFYLAAPGVLVAHGNGGPGAVFEAVASGVDYPQFTSSAVGAVILACKGSSTSCIFVAAGKGPNGFFQISPSTAAGKALVVKGAVSQTGNLQEWQDNSNNNLLHIAASGDLVSHGNNVVVGTAALATTATKGFVYLPTCAGAPTGTPGTNTGTVPLVFDTTNNKMCVYRGAAWHCVAGF